MAKILVIDDDPSLGRALRIGLSARGYEVVVARSGGEGIAQASLAGPDVILLDLGLPDLDGIEVCRRLVAFTPAPIIVLSAAGAEERKVATLDSGADDYVTKPFGMAELEARIRTALRHRRSDSEPALPESITVGPLDIDLIHHETRLHGATVDLTSKEFDVLSFLARHSSKTCTHQMILS